MKIIKVLHVDSVVFLRKLPLILIAIVLCIASFLVALPPQLLQSGTIPKVSIAFAYEGEEDEIIDIAMNFLGQVEVIDEFHLVSLEDAKQLLEDEEIDAAVAFPDDALDAFIDGDNIVIDVMANDEFIGSFAYSLIDEAVKTLNRVPQIALKYHRMIRSLFSDRDEFYKASMAFQMGLVQETLMRKDYIKTEQVISPFELQAMSLILFLLISIIAVFMTTLTSSQLANGGMRRLKLRGISFIDVWIGKAIIVVVLSLILSLAASLLFIYNNISFSVIRLLLASIFLSLILHMICMVFTLPKYKPEVASSRAMLGCVAMLLLMLFAGGGFYPMHLMDFGVRLFNPAWLAHLLSEWIIAGTPIPLLSTLCFLLPAIVCGLLSLKKWRDAFC